MQFLQKLHNHKECNIADFDSMVVESKQKLADSSKLASLYAQNRSDALSCIRRAIGRSLEIYGFDLDANYTSEDEYQEKDVIKFRIWAEVGYGKAFHSNKEVCNFYTISTLQNGQSVVRWYGGSDSDIKGGFPKLQAKISEFVAENKDLVKAHQENGVALKTRAAELDRKHTVEGRIISGAVIVFLILLAWGCTT